MWSGKGNWRDSRVIYKGRGLRFTVIKKFNTRNFILDSKKLGERMKKFSFHHSMPSPPPRASSMLSAYFPFCKCKSSEISSRISFLKVTLPSFFCFFFAFFLSFLRFPLLTIEAEKCTVLYGEWPSRCVSHSIITTANKKLPFHPLRLT